MSCVTHRVGRLFAVALMLVVGLVGLVVGAPDDPGLATIRADALKGHVYFLAAPEMGGRDSLSQQGLIAGQYLAGFFHRLGVKPVGDRKTFFQNFPMVEAHLDQANTYVRARLVATGSQRVGITTRPTTRGIGSTIPRWRRLSGSFICRPRTWRTAPLDRAS
jgi:hypothetical protein